MAISFLQYISAPGLTLSGFTTGTLINTSGVISALSGTNLVLANGTTLEKPSQSTKSITFSNEQNIATVSVSDTSVTATSVFVIQHNEEDLRVQDVSFYVSTITPGVGYVITGFAPSGATGIYTINSVKIIP